MRANKPIHLCDTCARAQDCPFPMPGIRTVIGCCEYRPTASPPHRRTADPSPRRTVPPSHRRTVLSDQ